jgi:predicted anti-sigma-YlaC factor YlaD
MTVRSPACDRARTWASLRLDGELSELEGALLDAHLSRCERCLAVVAGLEGLTTAVRATALVQPSEPTWLPPVRSRGSLRAFWVAAASLVALAAIAMAAGSLGALHVVAQGSAPPKLLHVSGVTSGMTEDSQLLAKVRVLRNERPVPGRIAWPA